MQPSHNVHKATVFIVGCGPVGMAMALLLDRFGIAFVGIERATGISDHPKARGADVRTMELLRLWGIEEEVRARGLPTGADSFAYVHSISGFEFGRTTPEPNRDQSPSWRCVVAQDGVEESLRQVVADSKFGLIRYGTEFVRYTEDSDGVTVETRDVASGATQTWHCDYLIGADGAGSSVRHQMGVDMNGPSTLSVMANDYWRGDLSGLPRIAVTTAYRIAPQTPNDPIATVLNSNGRDRWLSVASVGSDCDERPGSRTDAEVVALARKQTGLPNLDVQVISRSTWRLSRQVAQRFSQGRVFLIGDAAHRFPPNGGLGMNSGIHDAHNLAWKLGLVLSGRAGGALLQSYDRERRPVAEANADFSLGNQKRFLKMDEALRSGNRDEIEFWIRDTDNHIHSTGMSLGHIYEEGAVVQDGTVRPAHNPRYYTPTDRPGARFPHLWLDLTRSRSTLDWFDRDFVLVGGPQADAWAEAARQVSERTGITLQTRRIDLAPLSDGLNLGLRGAVLVRPDGHVAWRMPWLPKDPVGALGAALQTVLSR
jgi:2-polyprenyl-6-methoxyphenol hydroxylase-like FAD-dependent oxidoreductase